jgi:hypothetical protein
MGLKCAQDGSDTKLTLTQTLTQAANYFLRHRSTLEEVSILGILRDLHPAGALSLHIDVRG